MIAATRMNICCSVRQGVLRDLQSAEEYLNSLSHQMSFLVEGNLSLELRCLVGWQLEVVGLSCRDKANPLLICNVNV